jgi:serine/threonine protein kinase
MGSRKYRAPEVLRTGSSALPEAERRAIAARRARGHGPQGFRGFPADVWAMGCVLFSLVVGRLPFDGRDKTEQVWNVLNQPLALPSKIRRDPLLHDLLQRMLDKEPESRIQAKDALNHNWFSSRGK